MIELKNIYKSYHTKNDKITALKNINLRINKNEIFGIIGLSGAGKSTLIRTINGLEKIDQGTILVDKINITNLNKKDLLKERKNIGMIFQHFDLLNSRTVYRNVAFPLEISKVDKKIIAERVNELLDLVGLADKRDTYPSQLSGGQKQRVAIARALANNPKLLLCDEATSALDPETTKSILALLKKLQQTLDLTIIMITHQMEVVKEICDRVAVINNGEIVELGNIEEIFFNPKSKVTQGFINSIHSNDIKDITIPNKENSKLIKLTFIGESSKKPIISSLIKNNNVEINIISGNIDKLTSTNIGNLIIQISGNSNEIKNSINYLNAEGIKWEVINNDKSI
ncbi:ATP-binding cassette domain-containing protein [Clostridium sp. D2Q-14]|uniref:methionine ABC transporter ATP-binding protein n=1 Tax=Anaeromonas gelatinilytica TaxID=2683194 RepID=UPI00193C6898|nr:ATP-binding cassette domain-containing protein [Anaeromonas gelatinilytica]MBS4534827.1 ATP-binding cassette domain-containing protein [Anaeromonas gelatinilytica]